MGVLETKPAKGGEKTRHLATSQGIKEGGGMANSPHAVAHASSHDNTTK